MKKKVKETIARINKTKSWFFERVNKTDRPLVRFIKKKSKTQVNKIRNKKRQVSADNTEIQMIKRDYYQQLYANKMNNLEEMDKFLEKFNIPRLIQEEIKNMNRPSQALKLKRNQNFPTKNVQGQMATQAILPNILRRNKTDMVQTSENLQREKNTKNHSMRPPLP